MIPSFPVYLFDVDGTLLDSATDICGAVRDALSTTEAPPVTDAYLQSFIGHHLDDLFSEVLPHWTQDQYRDLLQTYRRIYLARGHRGTRIYDGVPAMLERLGGRKSTATTKSSETARNILAQFGLVQFFDHVQGTDGFPAKPEPEVIFRSLQVLGVRPEECLLIGDSAPDMAAGRRAGVKTCAVTYGYGDVGQMREHQPDYWISSPAELLPA